MAKLGRVLDVGPDGPTARLVAVLPHEKLVVDLARAERLRLERRGASPSAALRMAQALFPGSMAQALALGEIFLEAVERVLAGPYADSALPIEGLHWLPPIDPPVMRDCLAFEEHLKNTLGRLGPIPDIYYQIPIYYKGNPTTLLGHEAEVPWPARCQEMDFELELGFVIGKGGKDLTPDQAKGCIFGITIFNDFSARDIQRQEMTGMLGPAKGKDFATAVGPWITTADEIDLLDLQMVARVNGEEWSRGHSGSIMWRPEELVAYISQDELLQPGELIGSGTVGLGCGLELGRFLKPGDVVELEVEGVGILRNRMGRPGQVIWQPPPRRTG